MFSGSMLLFLQLRKYLFCQDTFYSAFSNFPGTFFHFGARQSLFQKLDGPPFPSPHLPNINEFFLKGLFLNLNFNLFRVSSRVFAAKIRVNPCNLWTNFFIIRGNSCNSWANLVER
jgi:hypothetical protein